MDPRWAVASVRMASTCIRTRPAAEGGGGSLGRGRPRATPSLRPREILRGEPWKQAPPPTLEDPVVEGNLWDEGNGSSLHEGRVGSRGRPCPPISKVTVRSGPAAAAVPPVPGSPSHTRASPVTAGIRPDGEGGGSRYRWSRRDGPVHMGSGMERSPSPARSGRVGPVGKPRRSPVHQDRSFGLRRWWSFSGSVGPHPTRPSLPPRVLGNRRVSRPAGEGVAGGRAGRPSPFLPPVSSRSR